MQSSVSLGEFINWWDINTLTPSSSPAIQKEFKLDFSSKIAEQGASILENVHLLLNQSYVNDKLEDYNFKADKIQGIHSRLNSLYDTIESKQEFLALFHLIKCSQAYIQLKHLSTGMTCFDREEKIKVACSSIRKAIETMVCTHVNESSVIYPCIQQLLSEISTSSLLDSLHFNGLDLMVTKNSFALSDLPKDLTNHKAFHSKAFFYAIEKLPQFCDNQNDYLTQLKSYLRFYTGQFSQKGENGDYILRKSSVPDYLYQEGNQTKIKYLTIACSSLLDGVMEHYIIFFDKTTDEWVYSEMEFDQITMQTLDTNTSLNFRSKKLEELLASFSVLKNPIPVTDKEQIKIFDDYSKFTFKKKL
jgi:hypothetical protein